MKFKERLVWALASVIALLAGLYHLEGWKMCLAGLYSYALCYIMLLLLNGD